MFNYEIKIQVMQPDVTSLQDSATTSKAIKLCKGINYLEILMSNYKINIQVMQPEVISLHDPATTSKQLKLCMGAERRYRNYIMEYTDNGWKNCQLHNYFLLTIFSLSKLSNLSFRAPEQERFVF